MSTPSFPASPGNSYTIAPNLVRVRILYESKREQHPESAKLYYDILRVVLCPLRKLQVGAYLTLAVQHGREKCAGETWWNMQQVVLEEVVLRTERTTRFRALNHSHHGPGHPSTVYIEAVNPWVEECYQWEEQHDISSI